MGKGMNKKKIIIIAIAAVVLCAGIGIGGYMASPAPKYKKAVELYTAEKWEDAAKALELLGDYKDSADMLATCQENIKKQKLIIIYGLLMDNKLAEAEKKIAEFEGEAEYDEWMENLDKFKAYDEANKIVNDAKPGDVVEYGKSYNNPEKPAEWIVLKTDSETVVLISKYVLNTHKYRTNEIYQWLEGKYSDEVFTSSEASLLHTFTYSSVGHVSDYGANRYSVHIPGKALVSDYLKDKKAVLESTGEPCTWWLYSEGAGIGKYEYITKKGKLAKTHSEHDGIGIRPVIVIDKWCATGELAFRTLESLDPEKQVEYSDSGSESHSSKGNYGSSSNDSDDDGNLNDNPYGYGKPKAGESFSDYVKREDPELYNEIQKRYDEATKDYKK